MPEISPEIKEELKRADWDNMTPKLVYFAQGRIWCYVRDDLLKGKSAVDFVDAAVLKVCTGVRQWNREKCPELIELLFGVIHSDVGHCAKGSEGADIVEFDELTASKVLDLEGRKFESSTPAQVLLQKEQDLKDNDFLMGLIDFLGQDKQLVQLAEIIVDGCNKEADMAKAMGISAKEVYNLKKRLGRRLLEYSKTRKAGGPVLEKGVI